METAVAGIVSMWQALSLVGILGWVILSPFLGLTRILRSSLQPWVVRRVIDETPMILTVQVRQLAPSMLFFFLFIFFLPAEFATSASGRILLGSIFLCLCAILHWFSPAPLLG